MSARFKDGPAAGVALNLQRSPVFLRVVKDHCTAAIDALDQLEDEPDDGEDIFAYKLASNPSRGFIDGTKYRGPVVFAEYALVAEQPTDEVMRSDELWTVWCAEEWRKCGEKI